ncbi:sensor histidine kinase [Alkaliphilus peptidifermentans]|uniref:Two-component system, sensor histidine kinase YesM n=1 Tax=Alkaliphilus peptidifermentans DSM 18978 TaxID=1120976 RepID=A0A1G5ITA6_9FIRM|nr:sensor histidine kinase [Alkaliphilus peptidifermentans]SCY79286.1 two-component system, sensor histidine kinase YesM [Alkaliphilus peptidifermentans DSM 18978]
MNTDIFQKENNHPVLKKLSSINNYLPNLRFRTKLLVSYIIIIAIPLGIMWYKNYSISMEVSTNLARQNIYEIVKQSNEIIDAQLSKIEENSLMMISEEAIFNIFNEIDPRDRYNLIESDKKIITYINKYLLEGKNNYSTSVVTSFYLFGNNTIHIPYEKFLDTEIYERAVQSNGALRWIPTYDYVKMYDLNYYSQVKLDYKYLFSAVRLLNFSHLKGGQMKSLDKSVERPVLIVNFKEDIFREVFENSLTINGSYYFIMDQDGNIISHSDEKLVGEKEKPIWMEELLVKGSGSDFVNINDKRMIVCYDTSKVTNWIAAVVISPEALMTYYVPAMKSYTINLAMMLLIASVLFAYLISWSITKPLNKLFEAIKKTGEGDFDTKIQIKSGREFGALISRFNNMNDKIKLLIEENYKAKIRQKETEIMALNIQMNPHFLYNTLNIINWRAIENKQSEISNMIISLSSMLQYTSQNQSEMEKFIDDFQWLKNYLFIMNYRFEGKFIVDYNMEPEIFKYNVPKLFLQPFVENAIIHGFQNIKSGGIIKISGWISDDKRYFVVEDNGIGMSIEEINTAVRRDTNKIGINNTNRRIKLIYGDLYGIEIESQPLKGTKIKVVLPK